MTNKNSTMINPAYTAKLLSWVIGWRFPALARFYLIGVPK